MRIITYSTKINRENSLTELVKEKGEAQQIELKKQEEAIKGEIDRKNNASNYADKQIHDGLRSIENAKNGIIASIKTIDDEQDTEITYYFGQELSGTKTSLEEYIENIQKINKADVLEVAKQISINTIYFLKN